MQQPGGQHAAAEAQQRQGTQPLGGQTEAVVQRLAVQGVQLSQGGPGRGQQQVQVRGARQHAGAGKGQAAAVFGAGQRVGPSALDTAASAPSGASRAADTEQGQSSRRLTFQNGGGLPPAPAPVPAATAGFTSGDGRRAAPISGSRPDCAGAVVSGGSGVGPSPAAVPPGRGPQQPQAPRQGPQQTQVGQAPPGQAPPQGSQPLQAPRPAVSFSQVLMRRPAGTGGATAAAKAPCPPAAVPAGVAAGLLPGGISRGMAALAPPSCSESRPVAAGDSPAPAPSGHGSIPQGDSNPASGSASFLSPPPPPVRTTIRPSPFSASPFATATFDASSSSPPEVAPVGHLMAPAQPLPVPPPPRQPRSPFETARAEAPALVSELTEAAAVSHSVAASANTISTPFKVSTIYT